MSDELNFSANSDSTKMLNPSMMLEIEYKETDESDFESSAPNIQIKEEYKDFGELSSSEIRSCKISAPSLFKIKQEILDSHECKEFVHNKSLFTSSASAYQNEDKNYMHKSSEFKHSASATTSNMPMVLKLECEGTNEFEVSGEQSEVNVESDKKEVNVEHCMICKICRQQSNNVRTFIMHYRIEHMGLKPFVCGKCNVGFYTITDLKEHHWTHRKRKRRGDDENDYQYYVKEATTSVKMDDDLYTCDVCSECCLNAKNYDLHMRTHINKNSQYMCSVCECSFSDYQNQARHDSLYHGDLKKKFNCSGCSQWFDTRSSCGNHVKHCNYVKRRSTQTYTCKICFQDYISIGKSKFCCNICERDISSIEDLKMKQNLAKSCQNEEKL